MYMYPLLTKASLQQCIKESEEIVTGGGGGRDEVWDRETMFSQLAKRSPSVVDSG